MVKSRKKKIRSRSKIRKQQAHMAPWGIGVAVVVVILGLAWRASWFGLFSTSGEPRDHEAFMGVTGSSYDAGVTSYTYPDPGGKGAGKQWLPALGDEDAPVVVMEFSDAYCGHCQTYHLTSLEGILQDYVATGKVRYVDHYFGFAQSHNDGIVEAEMCAAEQGRYFEFKHALFKNLGAGGVDITRSARDTDLDIGDFEACRRSQRYQSAAEEAAFVNTMGVTGTPTFFVNGQQVRGNRPDEIRNLIEAALRADQ